MDTTQATELLDQAAAGGGVMLAIFLVAGLILWALGRSLVRMAVSLSGLAIGGMTAFGLAQSFGAGSDITLAASLAGAIAGCLAAWRVFHVWMGLSMAIVLAWAVPAAMLVWEGPPPPEEASATARAQPDPLTDVGGPATVAPLPLTGAEGGVADGTGPGAAPGGFNPEDLAKPLSPQLGEQVAEKGLTLVKAIAGWWQAHREEIHAWWDGLGPAYQKRLLAATGAGALAGLLIGLLLPNLCAAFQTSLVGATLIFVGVRGLLAIFAPAQSVWLPTSTRAILITIIVLSCVGMMVQMSQRRKSKDG